MCPVTVPPSKWMVQGQQWLVSSKRRVNQKFPRNHSWFCFVENRAERWTHDCLDPPRYILSYDSGCSFAYRKCGVVILSLAVTLNRRQLWKHGLGIQIPGKTMSSTQEDARLLKELTCRRKRQNNKYLHLSNRMPANFVLSTHPDIDLMRISCSISESHEMLSSQESWLSLVSSYVSFSSIRR